MPWQETSPVSERERFVDAYLRGAHSLSELCRHLRFTRDRQVLPMSLEQIVTHVSG